MDQPNRTREYPYGRPISHNAITVILCRNEHHRENVTQAFEVPNAMYALIGSNPAGLRISRLITFEPEFRNDVWAQAFTDNWASRLTPDGEVIKVGY